MIFITYRYKIMRFIGLIILISFDTNREATPEKRPGSRFYTGTYNPSYDLRVYNNT